MLCVGFLLFYCDCVCCIVVVCWVCIKSLNRMQGSHRSLFYKTAPYKYAKHFNLTSVLDGLQGYKIVSGEADAIDDHNSGVFGELKAREKPQPSENKFYTRQSMYNPLLLWLTHNSR